MNRKFPALPENRSQARSCHVFNSLVTDKRLFRDHPTIQHFIANEVVEASTNKKITW
jgi:hypothetical protein